jgi:cytochrome c peroxidase
LATNSASAAALLAAALVSFTPDPALVPVAVRAPSEVAVPLGLPPLPTEPPDPGTVALGKKLFFERRLSFNDTMSCGMCHIEKQALTSNEVATSVGMEGKSLRRNAPSLFNVIYETALFRDGRETSLETQIWSLILSADEIAAPSVGWVLAKVRGLPDYPALFEAAFPGQGITMETIGAAIAAYERTSRRRNALALSCSPARPAAQFATRSGRNRPYLPTANFTTRAWATPTPWASTKGTSTFA